MKHDGNVESSARQRPGEATPLDWAQFAALVGPGAEKARAVRDLYLWLQGLDPAAELPQLLAQLRAGGRWLRARGALPAGYSQPAPAGAHAERLRLLLDSLDAAP